MNIVHFPKPATAINKPLDLLVMCDNLGYDVRKVDGRWYWQNVRHAEHAGPFTTWQSAARNALFGVVGAC